MTHLLGTYDAHLVKPIQATQLQGLLERLRAPVAVERAERAGSPA